MTIEIISYFEMCQRESGSLQKGMNYRRGINYSVILMSIRNNAPYRDQLEDDGATLIYEGHDIPKVDGIADPKTIDQPEFTASGRLTENGKFYKAAQEHKVGLRDAELVRVYEKIRDGIWSYNGLFELTDSWQESDGDRVVFKFKLRIITDEPDQNYSGTSIENKRMIPSSVKLVVWKRDAGKCVMCGSTNDLHFDHVIPYSKGGSSLTAKNIQLLCSKHNLEKSNRIE